MKRRRCHKSLIVATFLVFTVAAVPGAFANRRCSNASVRGSYGCLCKGSPQDGSIEEKNITSSYAGIGASPIGECPRNCCNGEDEECGNYERCVAASAFHYDVLQLF